jgi:hypothetical protein
MSSEESPKPPSSAFVLWVLKMISPPSFFSKSRGARFVAVVESVLSRKKFSLTNFFSINSYALFILGKGNMKGSILTGQERKKRDLIFPEINHRFSHKLRFRPEDSIGGCYIIKRDSSFCIIKFLPDGHDFIFRCPDLGEAGLAGSKNSFILPEKIYLANKRKEGDYQKKQG